MEHIDSFVSHTIESLFITTTTISIVFVIELCIRQWTDGGKKKNSFA